MRLSNLRGSYNFKLQVRDSFLIAYVLFWWLNSQSNLWNSKAHFSAWICLLVSFGRSYDRWLSHQISGKGFSWVEGGQNPRLIADASGQDDVQRRSMLLFGLYKASTFKIQSGQYQNSKAHLDLQLPCKGRTRKKMRKNYGMVIQMLLQMCFLNCWRIASCRASVLKLSLEASCNCSLHHSWLYLVAKLGSNPSRKHLHASQWQICLPF